MIILIIEKKHKNMCTIFSYQGKRAQGPYRYHMFILTSDFICTPCVSLGANITRYTQTFNQFEFGDEMTHVHFNNTYPKYILQLFLRYFLFCYMQYIE